jgi:hypothetical protein
MASEEQVLEAALSLLNAALPGSVTAYAHGLMPEPFPPEFVRVHLVRRSGGTARAGRYDTAGWALYVTAASSQFEANARTSLQHVANALENKVLTVGSEKSTPMRFDNARPITDDKGWHAGVSVYHFAI